MSNHTDTLWCFVMAQRSDTFPVGFSTCSYCSTEALLASSRPYAPPVPHICVCESACVCERETGRSRERERRRGTPPSVTCNNQCASHSPRNALVMLDARGWASKRWQLMATTGVMVHVEPTSLRSDVGVPIRAWHYGNCTPALQTGRHTTNTTHTHACTRILTHTAYPNKLPK